MLRKVLLGFFCVAVAVGVGAAWFGVDPKDRRPGLWLSGKEVAQLPADWSFTEAHPEVWLETRPWYGIPHSVTTVVAAGDGVLYVPSIYSQPGPFPGTKYWNRIVAANPEVRLKVGDELYPMRIDPIMDPAEYGRAFAALASKYPFWEEALENPRKRPPMALLRLQPRG
jgi:hypothetical protein